MRSLAVGRFLLLFGIASAPFAAEPDWGKVSARTVPLFYPGLAGLEWVMNSADHSGARKLAEGKQSCFDCHENDADVIGTDIVAGKKVGRARVVIDDRVPKGRRGFFPLNVQAAHDDRNLYLRFEWEGTETGVASDPLPDRLNEVKLSVMFDGGAVEGARLNGCWASCHMDLRTMPDTPARADRHVRAKAFGWGDGVTKYLAESRTAINATGKTRGGWDKPRKAAEIAQALKSGHFLDLMQYRSGAGQKPLDGYVLESRHMTGGRSLVDVRSERVGKKWTVTFVRRLDAAGVGDHALVPGRQYTFGFAIHENHGSARFHHVSLGYTLGLDDPGAFLNVARAGPDAELVQTAPVQAAH